MKKRSTTYRLNKVDYAIFIIFSIAAAAMLYLFYRDLNSFTIKQAEEPIAKIYFKKNTAQRKFIDNDIWEVLTDSSDIYDGDRIRTSKNSEAYTEFNDTGIQIQLREKSMIQINKNKKQRSVDFIGGEIYIANNSSEENLVIHTEKTDITIKQAAEVKIALPEVSEEASAGAQEPEESTVVVEVVSGQVEIIEAEEKVEAEPVVVTAGETVTLGVEIEKPADVAVEVAETEPEVSVEVSETEAEVEVGAGESQSEVETVTDNTVIETPVSAVEEKAPTPEVTPVVIDPELLNPTKPVQYNVQKQISWSMAPFRRSDYYNFDQQKMDYNYFYQVCSLEYLTEKSHIIPKGSVILVELKGIPDEDIREFSIQITTGEADWKQAHAFMPQYLNNGKGAKKNEPFELKRYITISSDIIDTSKSTLCLSYPKEKLDKQIQLYNFELKLTVLPPDESKGKVIPNGFIKTLNLGEVTPVKDVWGSGPKDYNYLVNMNADEIFGSNMSLPKGSEMKITVSGTADKTIQRFHMELIDSSNDAWTQVFMFKVDDDWGKLNFSENATFRGRKFNYTKSYSINQAFVDSNSAKLILVVDNEGLTDAPVFSDLEITVAVE